MILYHGSDVLIDRIDLTKSRPGKDFGRGFYLSDNYDQAMKMAVGRASSSGKEPAVTRFEVQDDILACQDLKTKVFKDYSNEWADFIFKNRKGTANDTFDIVYGPIADDVVGVQIRLFNDGYIDLDEFISRLKYYKGITFQYYFGTEKALSYLKYL